MSWSIGYDERWKRDIGYGVPAYCDNPGCRRTIDRGLAFVCGGEPYGGERGCGLYFCTLHLNCDSLCHRCHKKKPPFKPKPEHPDWVKHKMSDPSWSEWRMKEADPMKCLFWCNVHQRRATHRNTDGPRCNPQLGGIMLPCSFNVVDLTGLCVIVDEGSL